MKSAIAHQIPNQSRSIAAGLQGKGISRPAPNSVVQRQVKIEDKSGDDFNRNNFKIATQIFLSTVKGNFFDKISKAGPELELLIFAADQDSEKGGITAGVTRGMVRTKPENQKLEKNEKEEDAFSSLNYPKEVNWDKVNKNSPFRIEIGINMSKEAHKTPQDMTATMLHEWYVHAVNWEKYYDEMLQSDNVVDVFKGFDNDKIAFDEHKKYAEGKTGMDDALDEITRLGNLIKNNQFNGDQNSEMYKYLNQGGSKVIKSIKSAVRKDILAHAKMVGANFNPKDWKNLNPTPVKKNSLILSEINKESDELEKKRDRNEFGDDLKLAKEGTDLLLGKSKKKKEVVNQDLLVKKDN